MNIQDMVRQASVGYLYNNRYQVTLNAPPVIDGQFSNDTLQLISNNVSATTLPGTELLTGEWQNKGPTVKIPYKRNFNDVTMQIYNDIDGQARFFFEKWMESMYNLDSYNWEYRDECVSNIHIVSRDKYNNDKAAWTLYQAYPITIGDLNMEAEDGDIQSVEVTFAYTNYTMSA